MAAGLQPADAESAGFHQKPAATTVNRWLFSPAVDLGAFVGSTLLSMVLLVVGWRAGLLHRDTPDWTWVSAVLLIDVAHVWSTAFIVYFDAREFRRRFWLYTLVPVCAFAVGVALHLAGEDVFWRVLAYLAVFHFVRQQWGWVAMYRGRLREGRGWGLWLDRAAIYLATCYPLIYWHAHLDNSHFKWFRTGDFYGDKSAVLNLPQLFGVLNAVTAPIYGAVLALYALRAASLYRQRRGNPGKDLVVFTTALCWYVGIVAFNSDYAFTVTNVVIHGIPYFVLVFWYWRARRARAGRPVRSTWRLALIFVATLWLLAYVEELLWHRGKWHERTWLFGGDWDLTNLQMGPWTVDLTLYLVPLLAVPQITHYILDGFIWRRKSNPDLALLSGRPPA